MRESSTMLYRKIFDCISLEEKQYSIIENVDFTIEYNQGEFNPKEYIYIDKVDIVYEFIGLNINLNSTVLVDSKPYVFHIPREKIFSSCNSYLYNENYISTATMKSCSEIYDNNIRKNIRINEKRLNFLVCELQIKVKGRIGKKEFVATKDFNKRKQGNYSHNYQYNLIKPPEFPVSIRELGFKSVSFNGRLCIPQGSKRAIIYQNFENVLCVEGIIPRNNSKYNESLLFYKEKVIFRADIKLSLLSTKIIYCTITEKVH